jgi:ACS family tartrate transporter-like MFS transporter
MLVILLMLRVFDQTALINIHWLGWNGWRWLLILEVAAIAAAAWTFFYLTDRPQNAKWLTVEERDWVTNEFEQEKRSLTTRTKVQLWRVVFQPEVLVLTTIWFLSVSVGKALILWLPKIVQRMSGYGPTITTLVSAIPYLAAWPFTVWLVGTQIELVSAAGTAGCMILAAGGFALSRATDNVPVSILALTVAAMGINARPAPF